MKLFHLFENQSASPFRQKHLTTGQKTKDQIRVEIAQLNDKARILMPRTRQLCARLEGVIPLEKFTHGDLSPSDRTRPGYTCFHDRENLEMKQAPNNGKNAVILARLLHLEKIIENVHRKIRSLQYIIMAAPGE